MKVLTGPYLFEAEWNRVPAGWMPCTVAADCDRTTERTKEQTCARPEPCSPR